jgi:hypothetical protein
LRPVQTPYVLRDASTQELKNQDGQKNCEMTSKKLTRVVATIRELVKEHSPDRTPATLIYDRN